MENKRKEETKMSKYETSKPTERNNPQPKAVPPTKHIYGTPQPQKTTPRNGK